MEFIIELLFEIIIEGSLELGTHHKVPMPLRILALLLFLSIYGLLIGGIIMIGYSSARDGDKGVAGMMYLIAALLTIVIIYVIRKKFKENKGE